MKNQDKYEVLLKKIFSKKADYFKNEIIRKNPAFDFKKPVIIFGAAKMGRIFAEACKKHNIIVLAYCDNDPTILSTNRDGLIVINPKILFESYSRDIQIIVASESDKIILSKLKRLGFRNIWSYSFFFSLYAKTFFAFAHSSDFDEIYNNKDRIEKAYDVLKDDISKKTYVYLLLFRLTLDKKYLRAIQRKQEDIYFDQSIYTLSNNENVIDGGAFTGDTLRLFIKKSHDRFNNIYCFEPDLISYERLRKYVEKLNSKDNIFCLKAGLGEKSKCVQFTNEGNLQSSINNSGHISVQLVPIDQYISKKITLIKLDIEGYEKQALLGGKNTLKKMKPKLAICSYHYQKDLWEIPIIISRINPHYKIYLRHYSSHIYETICYGV